MKNEDKLAKLLAGTLSQEEIKEMEGDPDFRIYQKITQYSAELALPVETDDDELLHAIVRTEKIVTRMPARNRQAWWAVAASISLLLLAGIAYVWSAGEKFSGMDSAKVEVILPDASIVELKSGGILTYNRALWKWNRAVKLDGAAYFDVEKGSVFTVETALGSVRVLGTRFDVDNSKGNFKVNCYHGRVEVTQHGQRMILQAGQSLAILDKHWHRDSVFLDEPAWKQKQLMFHSTGLDGVIREMKNNYHTTIRTGGLENIAGKRFSGALPLDDQDLAIVIVEKAFSISFVKLSDGSYKLEGR